MGVGTRAASEPPLLTLGVAFLWIPGIFFLIGALIWLFIGSRMRLGGQVAATAGRARCALVRIGDPPVHLSGLTAAGPRGLLAAPVSGVECVWYRARVFRIYQGSSWRNTSDGWEPVATPAQERIWEGGSGPFAMRDESGGVLVDPVLLDRRTTREYPKETTIDSTNGQGPHGRRHEYGTVGTLVSADLLPGELLHQFAGPSSGTLGYRVTEEIVRPGLRFGLFAVPADVNGQPIMAPVGDIPAISVGGMAAVLGSGGKTAIKMAIRFGLASVACFAASAVLLMFRR